MKPTGFENILSGFSKISALKFEIWDEKGLVFCPDQGDPEKEASNPVQLSLSRMVTRIYKTQEFLYDEKENHVDLFGLPLFDNETIVGVLLAYASSPANAFRKRGPDVEDTKTLLTQIVDMIHERWEFQNESEMLVSELDRNYETLHLYSNVATQIKTLNLSNQMITRLMEEIRNNMRVDMAFSLMPDQPNYSKIVCKQELNIEDKTKFVDSLIKAIKSENKHLGPGYYIINNSLDSQTFSSIHQDRFRFLAVQIQHEIDVYGWLGIFSFNMDRIIERSQLKLLISIAEQIGVVISNTNLYHELEDFGIDIVKSLIATIEAKDLYTRGHSERVHYVAMLMARTFGMDKEKRNVLNWAALLHDVGKIGISETVLNKPGRLTDEEYTAIKKHPEKGAKIIKPLEYLAESIPGILHHHEHYNGKGYPSGLKGEKIPLNARIIAVADTFDAITSDRAYRKGRSYEKALEIINEVSGTQLDPEQVQIFNKIYHKLKTELEMRHAE